MLLQQQWSKWKEVIIFKTILLYKLDWAHLLKFADNTKYFMIPWFYDPMIPWPYDSMNLWFYTTTLENRTPTAMNSLWNSVQDSQVRLLFSILPLSMHAHAHIHTQTFSYTGTFPFFSHLYASDKQRQAELLRDWRQWTQSRAVKPMRQYLKMSTAKVFAYTLM